MIIAIVIIAMSSVAQVADKGDGNSYKTVKIATQVWMGENLNVSHFRNGDAIPEAKTKEEWKRAADNKQPAWCYYDNDPANGGTYGRLYNWYAVKDPRGLAPHGWHIPSDAEWTTLSDHLGGGGTAGPQMKSTSGWSQSITNNENGNGNNSSGFAGLPGGERSYDGAFFDLGGGGSWWSSSGYEDGASYAWGRSLYTDNGGVGKYGCDKSCGFSVRCLRD